MIAPLGVDEGVLFTMLMLMLQPDRSRLHWSVKLVYMTDVEGVKINGDLVSHLTQLDVEKYIANGTISGE